MSKLTREMALDLMNQVNELARSGQTFSKYTAYVKARENYDWDFIPYCDVRDEVDLIINKAVKEIGGLTSEFVDDNGNVYLLFSQDEDIDLMDFDSEYDEEDEWEEVEEENDDEVEEYSDDDECEEQSEFSEDDEDEYLDEEEDNENEYLDEEKTFGETVVEEMIGSVDHNGRLNITKEMFEAAGLTDDRIRLLYDEYRGEKIVKIIPTSNVYYHIKNREATKEYGGRYRISLNRYFDLLQGYVRVSICKEKIILSVY